jgi:hypothetical protein
MPSHSPDEIVAALRAEGIDCDPHELGLAEYCGDPVAYAKALKACQPALRLLTADFEPDACPGDPYVCDCREHAADRAASVARGSRERRHPWEPVVRRAA